MRDYRIDFFRGLALIVIFIDHVPYNLYSHLTPRNFGLSDAAEAFVLISGISAAYAYFGKFVSGDSLRATGLVVKRAGTLYVAHLFGTIAMLGIFAAGALWFSQPELLQQNNVGEFMADPVRGSLGVVALGHQFGYFNILPMYMVLLLMLPGFMALARRSLTLALIASFTLYVAAGTWRLNLPNFPNDGGWYFNPFAWQFLFALGVATGAQLKKGAGIPYSAWVYRLACLWLLVTGVWVTEALWNWLPDLPLPFLIYGNDKTFLTAGRLLHILALAYVIGQSPLAGWLGRKLTAANPLVMIGRYGLVSFCSATLLSMVGLVLKSAIGGGNDTHLVFDTLFIAAGLAALTGLAATLDILGKAKKADQAPAAIAETAVPDGLIVVE